MIDLSLSDSSLRWEETTPLITFFLWPVKCNSAPSSAPTCCVNSLLVLFFSFLWRGYLPFYEELCLLLNEPPQNVYAGLQHTEWLLWVKGVCNRTKKGGLAACCHKSQIHEADAGFIQVLRDLGEGQTPISKPTSSARPWEESNCPPRDQNKSQCSEFLLYFKVQSFGAHGWLSSFSPHPGNLTCSQLLSISGSLLEAMWATRASRSCTPGRGCKHTGNCIIQCGRERDFVLEAMGCVAARATWSRERTGKYTVQYRSWTRDRECHIPFVPLGFY